MREIVLLVHDIRSTHNVGSLLRTADGFGVSHVYFSGYTPYPMLTEHETRLPHLAQKLEKQIKKTALGAEQTVTWSHVDEISDLLHQLRSDGFELAALEQDARSQPITNYLPPDKVALLVGREVEGIELQLLEKMDKILEIPMFGQKESFNVVQAAAVALYALRFNSA